MGMIDKIEMRKERARIYGRIRIMEARKDPAAYAAMKERWRAQSRRWRAANPELVRMANRKAYLRRIGRPE